MSVNFSGEAEHFVLCKDYLIWYFVRRKWFTKEILCNLGKVALKFRFIRLEKFENSLFLFNFLFQINFFFFLSMNSENFIQLILR